MLVYRISKASEGTRKMKVNKDYDRQQYVLSIQQIRQPSEAELPLYSNTPVISSKGKTIPLQPSRGH
jgi:hypothetical protein